MRVAIAGAGAVGRSIAAELLENGHEVLLIDKNPKSITVDSVPRAEWLLADACEISSLDDAALERCNVVIAATGDDKANLVVSLLAKTEYGVPRVVARINHPNNEWLFNESWGVDVAVSTPRLLSALVEEAVSVGDLVRLMTFRQSEATLVELTMPDGAPLVGQRIGDIDWPADTALVAILRDGRVIGDGPVPFRLGHLLLHGLPRLLGQPDLEQVPRWCGMIPADHHDAREDVLQRLGGRPVMCRRSGDDPPQEPARPVDTEEADRLQCPRPRPGPSLRRDPGPKLGPEPAVGLLARAAGLGDRRGDLAPHVLPEPAALGRGERLELQGTSPAQHGDQRPLLLGEVQLDLESLAHRYLEAAEVDPLVGRELILRVPRAVRLRASRPGLFPG